VAVPARQAQMQASRRLPVAAVLGAVVLAALFAFALLGKSAAPYDPEQVSDAVFQPPSGTHLLGTNDLGQDVFSELVAGTRLSMFVGISVATLSTVLAWSVGLISGYAPGGEFIIAASDLLLAIPALPLLVLLVAYGGTGLTYIIVAMGLLSWPAFARIVRSQVLSTRERDYVIAAYAAGAKPPRVVIRHILPETVPIIATKFVLTARWAVLVEATLAFLGLTDPGSISWGNMLNHAFRDPLLFTRSTWVWSALPPATAIVILVLSLALIAQITEPKARRVLPEA
jgi:ABC-type dipeptide/oligopeptide/nickel transport system permease subunit